MQWNKFRLSFNIYEDKNLLSPKHPLAWHIIIGSTPALPFYFIPVEQKTSPALVDQPVGHCQTEWTMNYFCLFFLHWKHQFWFPLPIDFHEYLGT